MRRRRWHETTVGGGGRVEGSGQFLEDVGFAIGISVGAKVKGKVVRCRVIDLGGRRLILESARAELLEVFEVHRIDFYLLSLRRSHLVVVVGHDRVGAGCAVAHIGSIAQRE